MSLKKISSKKVAVSQSHSSNRPRFDIRCEECENDKSQKVVVMLERASNKIVLSVEEAAELADEIRSQILKADAERLRLIDLTSRTSRFYT